MLAKVNEANQLTRVLPPDVFYNALISDKMDVQDHYTAWRQTCDMPADARNRLSTLETPFSFCSYAFLLNPRAKSNLLAIEARFQMEQTVAQARMEQQLYGSSSKRKTNKDTRIMADKLAMQGCPSPPPAPRSTHTGSGANDWMVGSGASVGTSGSGEGQQRQHRGLRGLLHHIIHPRGGGSPPRRQSDNSSNRNNRTRDSSNDASSASASASPAPSQASASAQPPHGAAAAGNTPSSSGWNATTSARMATVDRALPPPHACSMPGTHSDMCIMRVRRLELVNDALDELARQYKSDLFKPLR